MTQVTAWHAYNDGAGNAEIVLHGDGFGESQGGIKYIVQGGGAVRPADADVEWSDDTIRITGVAVDSVIKRVFILTIDERGKDKVRGKTPAGEERDTSIAVPASTVTGSDDTEDHIVLNGTNLDQVGQVTLIDSSVPAKYIEADFTEESGDLLIEWPAVFTSPIASARLSDANGQNTFQHDAAAPGWEQAPNGIVTDVVGAVLPGPQAGLNIFGTDLGNQAGQVRIRKQGGTFEDADVIAGGWSSSLVQVAAEPVATYDGFEVLRADGELATIAGTVPATVVTPAIAPEITDFDQGGAVPGATWTIAGSGLTALEAVILRFINQATGSTYANVIYRPDLQPTPTHNADENFDVVDWLNAAITLQDNGSGRNSNLLNAGDQYYKADGLVGGQIVTNILLQPFKTVA